VAIIAHGINFLDLAGAEALADEARRRRQAGGGLYLIGVKDTVQEQLAESGALKAIGAAANLFDSKTEAIADIYARLDAMYAVTARREFSANARRCVPSNTTVHPLIPAGVQP